MKDTMKDILKHDGINFGIVNDGINNYFIDRLIPFQIDGNGYIQDIAGNTLMGWQANEGGIKQESVSDIQFSDAEQRLFPCEACINPYWTTELEDWFNAHPEYEPDIQFGFINKYNGLCEYKSIEVYGDGIIWVVFENKFPKFTNEFDSEGNVIWSDGEGSNPKFDGYYTMIIRKMIGQIACAEFTSPHNLRLYNKVSMDDNEKMSIYSATLSSGDFCGIGIENRYCEPMNKNYWKKEIPLKVTYLDRINNDEILYPVVSTGRIDTLFKNGSLNIYVGVINDEMQYVSEQCNFNNEYIIKKETIKPLSEFNPSTDCIFGNDENFRLTRNWALCDENGLLLLGWNSDGEDIIITNVTTINLTGAILGLHETVSDVFKIIMKTDGKFYAVTNSNKEILIGQLAVAPFTSPEKLIAVTDECFDVTNKSSDFDGFGIRLISTLPNDYIPEEITPDSKGQIIWKANEIYNKYNKI